MTIINPEGIPLLAATAVKWVSTIASLSAPKLTEVNAASPASLDVSLMLLADSWEVTQDVGKGAAPRRLGQRSVLERFTTVTGQTKDLQYVIDPQASVGSDGKKASEVLTEGLNGYFVERPGLDILVPWAVGQFVRPLSVTLGKQLMVTGGDENADYTVMQPWQLRATIPGLVALVV